MADRPYRATLSKSQGREGWSIIFRHPLSVDPATGKPGRRVRMGLGTSEAGKASRLVDEMNEILSNSALWDASARPRAEQQFDQKVVDIFYHGLVPEMVDFFALRGDVMPLPSS